MRLQRDDTPGAEAALRKARDVDPSRASGWERLAALLESRAGRTADAEGAWRKAEQAGSLEALYALGRLAAGEGHEMRAVAWWRRYLNEAPDGLHVDEARAAVERMELAPPDAARRGNGPLLRSRSSPGSGSRSGSGAGSRWRSGRGGTRERRATSGPCSGRLSHEVFKHGGLLLGDVEERLSAGEDFRPSAEILAARLYGSGPGPWNSWPRDAPRWTTWLRRRAGAA